MIMSTLKEKLEDFEKQIIENKINETQNEDKLQELFRELAPAFLYGGYIKVREDYKVYIWTVEFYFHSEKGNGIHDPIVYHRNNRNIEGDIPYLPLMSINAHSSGFDITFENDSEKYRASALIRSYEVKSKGKDGKEVYLIWNKEKKMFVKSLKYGYNEQSTYLYDLLNGFNISKDYNNKVVWENVSQDERVKKDIKANIRNNVPLYRIEDNNYVKITKDFYINKKDYVEKLHPEIKKVKPQFFASGKEICLRDPKLWQFYRVTEI